jgi:Flp pilus assembly protein TadD
MRAAKQRGIASLISAGLLLFGAAGPTRAGELSNYERSGASFEEGLALAERGFDERAIKAYEQAIQLDPAFVEAMVNLARVHLARGELERASTWLNRAARVESGYPDLHTVRGLVSLAEGRLQDALATFGRARELAPEDVEVLTNLGATLLRLGVLDEARTILEQALRLDPARPEAALDLALLWDHRGDSARAVFLYERFLGLVPTDDPGREQVEKRVAALESGPLKVPEKAPEEFSGVK